MCLRIGNECGNSSNNLVQNWIKGISYDSGMVTESVPKDPRDYFLTNPSEKSMTFKSGMNRPEYVS